MTGTNTSSAPTSRPSSSLSQHQDQHRGQNEAAGDKGPLAASTANNEAGDESMNLSSPTTQKRTRGHPLKSAMLAETRDEGSSTSEEEEAEDEQEGGDVLMDVGYNDEETEEGEQKLTNQMNADERREKLRRRTTGRKGESDEA
jgi:hypothetical protein